MLMIVLASIALLAALIPAALFLRNLSLYQPVPWRELTPRRQVSVLIPARNEEAGIEQAVRSALASDGVEVEVVVLDDHSTDRTAAIVRAIALQDPRVRLETAPPLPVGWCGKQFACWTLASLARHDAMLFVDADVQLDPRGAAKAIAFLESSGAALVSGVPRQITATWSEKLVIPLIQFLLLGFLPLHRMRQSAHPAYGAGCGQFFLTTKSAYEKSGGHAAIRASLHDGVKLPRAFRSAGLMTDLFDTTDVAACRMYRNATQVWNGLAKNATEGLAAPRLIVPATSLLVLGQVLPMVLLVLALLTHAWLAAGLSTVATVLAYVPRVAGAARFRQSWLGAVLHPLGVLMLVTIQWYALLRLLLGRPVRWRTRSYGPAAPDRSSPAAPAGAA